MSNERSILKTEPEKTPVEKVKEIPINKYSIYEIKASIDSKIIEVNLTLFN
jgi:hypothetical protein